MACVSRTAVVRCLPISVSNSFPLTAAEALRYAMGWAAPSALQRPTGFPRLWEPMVSIRGLPAARGGPEPFSALASAGRRRRLGGARRRPKPGSRQGWGPLGPPGPTRIARLRPAALPAMNRALLQACFRSGSGSLSKSLSRERVDEDRPISRAHFVGQASRLSCEQTRPRLSAASPSNLRVESNPLLAALRATPCDLPCCLIGISCAPRTAVVRCLPLSIGR